MEKINMISINTTKKQLDLKEVVVLINWIDRFAKQLKSHNKNKEAFCIELVRSTILGLLGNEDYKKKEQIEADMVDDTIAYIKKQSSKVKIYEVAEENNKTKN